MTEEHTTSEVARKGLCLFSAAGLVISAVQRWHIDAGVMFPYRPGGTLGAARPRPSFQSEAQIFPPEKKKIEDAFNFWMLPWQLSSWTSEVQFAACSKSVSLWGIVNRQGGMKSSV